MDYFEDIYCRRLNRYGLNYQSRVQTQREREFEVYLTRSVYRIDFEYMDDIHPATLEPNKQNNTEIVAYLLTRVSLDIPNGTILMLSNKNGELKPWMIYWLEEIRASGYNRYTILKMTNLISWKDRAGNIQTSWAYMYGQEDNMLKDELQSRSRMDSLYKENLKDSFFVLPTNEFLRKDDYIEIGEGTLKEAFRVTGYDIHSTKGVEFVTVDPVYLRDNTPPPERTENTPKEDDDFHWLEWGEH